MGYQVAHATFVTSRKTDPALGERERALSDLNSTFAIHRELVTNLEEGLRFYTDLSRLLSELRDQVRGVSSRVGWLAGFDCGRCWGSRVALLVADSAFCAHHFLTFPDLWWR